MNVHATEMGVCAADDRSGAYQQLLRAPASLAVQGAPLALPIAAGWDSKTTWD